MNRLYVVVEGQTEEGFIRQILAPHLQGFGVWTTPIIVSTGSRSTGQKFKGGGHWKHWHGDLLRVLREQTPGGAWVTTLFDLYGLPGDFPDRAAIGAAPTPLEKTRLAEAALQASVKGMVGERMFIPYVQQHEFEALVLASLEQLALVLDDPADLAGLDALTAELEGLSPEEVNDSPETAPSKRLMRHIPGYDKVLHGELALTDVPLADLCVRCPRFGAWVRRLEQLGPP
ncbi:MAG: DUF4276 family protein [Alphaproteobacteria bacterium]|nr:DUF4276 family protein [Alphaproteobacteria bacterium]